MTQKRISPFYRFGKAVSKYYAWIILIWVFMVLVCLPLIPNLLKPFNSSGFLAINSESAKAETFLTRSIPYQKNRLIVLYSSKTLKVNSAKFQKEIKQSLSKFINSPKQYVVILPSQHNKQQSLKHHMAYAVIAVKSNSSLSVIQYKKLVGLIQPTNNLTFLIGGENAFLHDVNQQTQEDLVKADVIAAPIAIITLLFVFGSLFSAILPIMIGAFVAILILSTLFGITHLYSLSIFTLNIALLLGLCLTLDYALFIIKRFREEYRDNQDIGQTIAKTMSTAGRAVFVSGLTVLISLSGLFLFPVNVLRSLGVGGVVSVIFAVFAALTLLPAVLTLFKCHLNKGSIRNLASNTPSIWWGKVAALVIEHRKFFFVFILLVLIILGLPFLKVKLGVSDQKILPQHSQSYQFYERFNKAFSNQRLMPIQFIVSSKKEDILKETGLKTLYELVQTLSKWPQITNIEGLVNSHSKLSKEQLKNTLLHKPLPTSLKQTLKLTTSTHATVLTIIPKDNTTKLIQRLRQLPPPPNFQYQIIGQSAINYDVLQAIKNTFLDALAWIFFFTYLVLMLMFRSLFIPLKAIVMNVLSLTASYGVLVFIFQQGHGAELLQFTPQGMLDISLIVIIFCALFGFSMDYEVFLLSRIQECYQKTHNTKDSIVTGISKSASVITSAALIVIVLCGSFMVADVLMVKAFGLGIAIAIGVDAFIIRLLFVPATMMLMEKWNWYLPKFIAKNYHSRMINKARNKQF